MASLSEIGNKNLSKLPGLIALKIRSHLDISDSPAQGWRAFLAVLDGDYAVLGRKESLLQRAESPTSKILTELSVKGMTIEEFVKYCILADEQIVLELFSDIHVPVKIITSPLEQMELLEGETSDLRVKATGFPPPQYQWYKDGMPMEGERDSCLRLIEINQTHSGQYCCAVYNCDLPELVCFSSKIYVTVKQAPELEIKENPHPCIVCTGGSAMFRCEACGGDNLRYQWFKDETPLQDSDTIQGSQTCELRLYNIQSADRLGCYFCQVSQHNKVVCSAGAVLQIKDLVKATHYRATDKVALLIGCNDYRSDKSLSAPKGDVQTLSSIFQSLNFKVVSLLNLTKEEMNAAVYEFLKLVGKGVYCVFYFCGHGFEIWNQCFLVPTDAPLGYTSGSCVSADKIFTSMLQREPEICCMILDICRKGPQGSPTPEILAQETVSKGNGIVCYGTSYGLAAYEETNYGILVNHLKNVLSLPIDIEDVFKRLRIDMNNDPRVNRKKEGKSYKQIPEVRTNLQELGRSFTDPIESKGHTAEFKERQSIWEMAHRKPDPIMLDFEFDNFVVKLRLDFKQEFSNVLKIFTTVIDPGPTETCLAYVCEIPSDIAEKAKVASGGLDSKFRTTHVVLHNIQRLKSKLRIGVHVSCTGPSVEKTEQISDLGFPLVARLELWKKRPDLLHQRKAEEVDEEGEEINSFYSST